MKIVAILICLISIFSCQQKEKISIEVGSMYMLGPTSGPDGELLSNVIKFHYKADEQEPINIIKDGKQIEVINIKGAGVWRIELNERNLIITEGSMIFECPIEKVGILDSAVSTNELNQMVFDISVAGRNIIRIECPKHVINSQTDET